VDSEKPSVEIGGRATARADQPAMKPGMKAALDFAPVLIFFVTYFVAGKILGKPVDAQALDPGLMWATIVFMPATVIALGVAYAVERKVHLLPLVTAAIVLIFGGLTLALHDATFIKMKPTIIYVLLAAGLLGGLAVGRLFLKEILGTAFELDEPGWRKLTLRWGLFFVAMAVLNEVLRRVLSTVDWVIFKVWGFTALVLIFSLWQALMIAGRQAKDQKADE
jgi:intracellular septation protein